MVSADMARVLALGFPEASEKAYHGFPSWRVMGKMFANLPDATNSHDNGDTCENNL